MKPFTLLIASLVWAGASVLVDGISRNFGLSFGVGAVAALLVVFCIQNRA